MSRYRCDTNIISIRHLVKTSATVIYLLGVHITLECSALIAAGAIGKYGELPHVNSKGCNQYQIKCLQGMMITLKTAIKCPISMHQKLIYFKQLPLSIHYFSIILKPPSYKINNMLISFYYSC